MADKLVRTTLGGLLLLLAINAFGGGYYAMAGAENVPVVWLKDSPFSSYFIPGIILFTVVGGSALFACIMVFRKQRIGSKAALVCGIITIVWLFVQVAIIGYVSLLQPITGIAAICILILAIKLPEHAH
jgi:hypothetical protein